jgi:hypothetical protein
MAEVNIDNSTSGISLTPVVDRNPNDKNEIQNTKLIPVHDTTLKSGIPVKTKEQKVIYRLKIRHQSSSMEEQYFLSTTEEALSLAKKYAKSKNARFIYCTPFLVDLNELMKENIV